jgi:hypothetical protein
MWTNESNSGNKFDSFAASVGSADTAGSWQEDYEACCLTNKIDACPFFKVANTSPTTSSCKLLNTSVDLASWRAMIVAAATKNSGVEEIVCHNVTLSRQHLVDLTSLLKTSEVLMSVKLDYIEFVSEGEGEGATTLAASLLPLLVEATNLKFLSLKGNKLDGSFVTPFSDTVMVLPCLEGLNLSENNITDEAVTSLFKVFPYCLSLKHVSLKSNPITGTALQGGITDLVQGQPMGTTGELTLKNMQKLVTDKNKSIQATNKNRKKANLEELAELVPPPNRIVNNPGEENRVLNRCLELLDFSHCSWDTACVAAFLETAAECSLAAVPVPEGERERALQLRLRGVEGEAAARLAKETFSGQIIVSC